MLDILKIELGKFLIRLGQELVNSSTCSYVYRKSMHRNRYTW